MQTRRLLKLADFLDYLRPREFSFADVVKEFDKEKECGTICCAVGWTPAVFPRLVAWNRYGYLFLKKTEDAASVTSRNYASIAAYLFDLSEDEASALFSPWVHRPWSRGGYLDEEARPKTVAKSIRDFVKWKKSGGSLD